MAPARGAGTGIEQGRGGLQKRAAMKSSTSPDTRLPGRCRRTISRGGFAEGRVGCRPPRGFIIEHTTLHGALRRTRRNHLARDHGTRHL